MLTRCLGCMQTFDDQYQICPHCGYVVGTPAEEAIHMPPGTLLHGRYTLGRVLGFGGFGVTYLAWDSRLEQKVAIKEYLPGEFSTRMPGQSQVSIFSGDKAEQFRDGLKQFVDEAKRLARFQNEEGIATVYDSFEENDTAYIIMEYLEGETLTEYLNREGKIPEDEAVAMLLPLMESLQRVHEAGILHRDIAPDNIFLTSDGQVKLIDFGAARYATTSHSRSLTVIIKPGYSPEEQYRSRGDQGPHTDVYALGATLYKMITGITPPDAMERRARYENQNKDILEAPQKYAKGLSLARRNAILNAMNVRIEDRTPDVNTFMEELQADPPAKRIYGKIKKIDVYAWPAWLKVVLPALGTLVMALGVLLLTGVISIRSPYSGDIILPEGVVEVPEVEGLSSAEAIRLLTESRLITQSGGNVKSEYVVAGLIILQNPSPGSYVPVNSAVELMVSAGTGVTPPFNGVATVPYVIWDSLEEARSKLAEAGLGEPQVEEIYDDNVAEGQVISANHEAGEELAEQSVLTVTVSKGPAPFVLQNVVGLEEGEARKILEERGLQLSFVYQNDSTVPEGQVLEQSLEEGTQVRKGDALSLVVSSGKPTFDVADVSGMEQKDAEKSLKDQGFEVVILENFDDEIPAGQVIRQEPAAGTSQTEGSQITVYISKGRQMVTITFDPNGGEVSEEKRELAVGDAYGELPEPSRKGYTFEGWFEAKKDGQKAEPGMQAGTANVTLQARWREIVVVVTTPAPTTPAPTTPAPTMPEPTQPVATTVVVEVPTTAYVPTTTPAPTTTLAPTTVSPTLPVVTTVAPTTVPPTLPVATTVAPTTPAPTTMPVVTTQAPTTTASTTTATPKYTLTFNANGGSVGETSRTLELGVVYGDLPTPIREGYSFEGWFTAAEGGSQVNTSTVMGSANISLYAHWKKKGLSVGEYITFGKYGGENIEWIVICIEGSNALVFSKYIIEFQRFQDGSGRNPWDIYATWDNSSLRQWLNNDFYSSAFSESEKSRILSTNVSTEDNPEYGTYGGNNTKDYLFLLSIGEVKKYSLDEMGYATKFIREKYNIDGSPDTWWLRTKGMHKYDTTFINRTGEIALKGDYDNGGRGVRPAMWIKIKDD